MVQYGSIISSNEIYFEWKNIFPDVKCILSSVKLTLEILGKLFLTIQPKLKQNKIFRNFAYKKLGAPSFKSRVQVFQAWLVLENQMSCKYLSKGLYQTSQDFNSAPMWGY